MPSSADTPDAQESAGSRPRTRKTLAVAPGWSPGQAYQLPDRWMRAFLVALSVSGVVTAACDGAKIARRRAYTAREQHPDFKAAWDEALERYGDSLVEEATRRAREGTLEPVYQQGSLVGEKLVYSDTLLVKLLEARVPEFKRQTDITSGGKPLQPIFLPIRDDEVVDGSSS